MPLVLPCAIGSELARVQADPPWIPGPVIGTLPKIHVPVLVVWGEQDRVLDVSGAGEMAKVYEGFLGRG